MTKFDFILFENYHLAINHKIDLVLIAKMLQHEGKNVAILNIYGEDNDYFVEGIPIINLPFTPKIPNDKWQKNPKNKLHSLFSTLRFLYEQHFYMKKVANAIYPMADQFYCGSYHLRMTSQFFRMRKPCYYWGLRSERMNHFWKHFIRNPINGIRLMQLKKSFKNNQLQRLFVSNSIIMKEFENLGIASNRMVIREERCVEKLPEINIGYRFPELTFLVIGQLRKEKHIDTTISAFKLADIPNSTLKLVGRARREYESIIMSSIDGDNRIERISKFLSYEEFNQWFVKSHFVLFADEQGPSCITNGTMMEALINYRPVICPNYNPYSYYINKYGVGLLYEAGNVDNYAATIKKAAELGTEYFIPNIKKFLENILFDKVSEQLINDIDKLNS